MGRSFRPKSVTDLSDLITVLVVTSPTASDPSTATIEATIRSTACEELADARLLVGADGIRPEQRELTEPYEWKLDHIRNGVEFYSEEIELHRLPSWGHQANVMRMLLAEVTTPLVLFLEHDTPFTPNVPIDWNAAALTILEGELNLVRFLHESHILPDHAHLMLDAEPRLSRAGLPHIRTAQWSQRPHLALTSWYRGLIDTYFAVSSRTMIEDCLYGPCFTAWRELGIAGWDKWKLGIYADPEPTMQRSEHLDGRAGGEKYGMTFAYPGDTWPRGAPAPTLGRVFE